MNHLTIRKMTPGEVDWALQLAAAEGWNPGLFDAACFYQTDPAAFLIGLLQGKPAGCISAVWYPGAIRVHRALYCLAGIARPGLRFTTLAVSDGAFAGIQHRTGWCAPLRSLII